MKCPLHTDPGPAQPLTSNASLLCSSSLTLIVHHIASQSVTCSEQMVVCHELCRISLHPMGFFTYLWLDVVFLCVLVGVGWRGTNVTWVKWKYSKMKQYARSGSPLIYSTNTCHGSMSIEMPAYIHVAWAWRQPALLHRGSIYQ